MRKIITPAIPDIPEDTPKPLRDVLEAMKQWIDIREGRAAKGTNARSVSIQDLVDAGVVPDGKII
jgi:hypothetical protein